MHTRNSIALLLVQIGSCVLLLTSGASAIGSPPINNIDIYQPVLRVSPARGADTSDLFGWAAVMHQMEMVNPGDTREEAAQKTRLGR